MLIVILETLSTLQCSHAQPLAAPYWKQYKKAEELLQQQNYLQALDILIPLANEQPNFNVYMLIAESYFGQQKPELALSYYKKAYALSKDRAPADYNKRVLFGLAKAELALKNAQAAHDYYQDLLIFNLSASEQKTVEDGLNKSNQLLKKEGLNELIPKAQGYIAQGDGAQAYQLIEPLLNQQSSIVHIAAGDSLALLGKPKEALQNYQQALQLARSEKNSTDERVALFAIARMQRELREFDEANKTYTELLSMSLNSADQQIVFQELQQIKQLQIESKLQEIRGLLLKNKNREAAQLIEPLLKYHSSSVYLVAGDIQASLEQPQKAIDYYQQTFQYAKLENNNTFQRIALFAIARMRLALHDTNEARKMYQQLLLMNLSEIDRKVAEEGLKQTESTHETAFDQEIERIQSLIEREEGQKALKLLAPLLTTHKKAIVYLMTAHAKALTEQPNSALSYYQQAYSLAKNEKIEVLQQISLFGIARMELVLRQPEAAIKTYLQILHLKLNKQDRALAQQGLNKAYELQKQVAYEKLLQRIYGHLDSEEGLKAYQLILPLIKQFNQPLYYMLAAKSMIVMDQPYQALNYYKNAYQLALQNSNRDDQREALTGIATMQMWLDQYVRATITYRLLLTYPLNLQEYELAKAGLVKSYAYRGRVYTALDEIPWDIQFTSPHMVIAALQATLWTGQGDVANQLYLKYRPILNQIKPGEHLYRDLKNIEWLLCLETAPYQLKPEIYSFKDSEDFTIQRETLRARRYWSQSWQSKIAPTYIRYAQSGVKIDAKTLLFNQTWRPSRHLILDGEVAPTTLNHWSPVLWGFSGSYIPDDILTINISAREELIESFTALENDIFFHSYNLGGVLQPLPYVNIIANQYQFNFNDQNTRDGYYVYGSVTFWPTQGVYAGYRIRGYTSAFQSPFYFSPDKYNDKLYILGISNQIGETWRYFAEGGYGSQSIKPNPEAETGTAPSWFYRFGLRGPIRRCVFFDIQYGNYQQASAFIDAEDYRFHDILASLTFSFD
ncbi:tetratricopeptide repeat protein [Legionella brunensis]|uniref:Tetratricopeptide repeat protein n=1 Tax=Legionella brunensis TaxID=29422 RepID=A0A0W0SNV1_9GAMM|nr:tetratricopeptide repeat protein [Legionella brunensis]KTC84979.1 Tetratricopeptide repeat protein [Legionella brunensis]